MNHIAQHTRRHALCTSVPALTLFACWQHLDTAEAYLNEEAVGAGIQAALEVTVSALVVHFSVAVGLLFLLVHESNLQDT